VLEVIGKERRSGSASDPQVLFVSRYPRAELLAAARRVAAVVHTAQSAEALALAGKHDFLVVVVDAQGLDQHPLSLVRQLVMRCASLVPVLITPATHWSAAAAALRQGVVALLQVPNHSAAQVQETLLQVLSQHVRLLRRRHAAALLEALPRADLFGFSVVLALGPHEQGERLAALLERRNGKVFRARTGELDQIQLQELQPHVVVTSFRPEGDAVAGGYVQWASTLPWDVAVVVSDQKPTFRNIVSCMSLQPLSYLESPLVLGPPLEDFIAVQAGRVLLCRSHLSTERLRSGTDPTRAADLLLSVVHGGGDLEEPAEPEGLPANGTDHQTSVVCEEELARQAAASLDAPSTHEGVLLAEVPSGLNTVETVVAPEGCAGLQHAATAVISTDELERQTAACRDRPAHEGDQGLPSGPEAGEDRGGPTAVVEVDVLERQAAACREGQGATKPRRLRDEGFGSTAVECNPLSDTQVVAHPPGLTDAGLPGGLTPGPQGEPTWSPPKKKDEP
jgi:ActR/RegA family two-component response regulator